MLGRLLAEPPFRLAMKAVCRYLPVPVAQKAWWDASDRPHYLAGVLYAAQQAQQQGRDAIAVIEFGVADGAGLVALQKHAAAVERATGVRVQVYGFDSGTGMPRGTGDYRDHPDVWLPGDYAMDVAAVRAQLAPRTELVLGDVDQTVHTAAITAPLGFVILDLDFYSSTLAALELLAERPRLRRVAMYFDDLSAQYNHDAAGELLAIREFNAAHPHLHIDRWRGLETRPFPEAAWHQGMYIAHDLLAISETRLKRSPAKMLPDKQPRLKVSMTPYRKERRARSNADGRNLMPSAPTSGESEQAIPSSQDPR